MRRHQVFHRSLTTRSISNYTVCDNCGIEIHGLGMTVTETDCPECGETTSVTPVGGPREILRSQVTSSPAVNGGASPSTAGNPVVRFGFKTGSPGVDGAGFDPRPGASCGAVTGAPIRKRVIAVDFQPTALTQSVEPRGSVSARFTPCRPKAINRASRAPQTWVECGPHPALVRNGMWRNPIETHVCGRLSGFGGVPAVPLAAVASRNGRDSRPP